MGLSSILMMSVGSTGTADAAVTHELCPDFEDNTFVNDANRQAVCVTGMRPEEATQWRISGKKITAGVSGRHVVAQPAPSAEDALSSSRASGAYHGAVGSAWAVRAVVLVLPP